ncbi:MAG: ATP-binding protein [Pirellulaceae bacterium]
MMSLSELPTRGLYSAPLRQQPQQTAWQMIVISRPLESTLIQMGAPSMRLRMDGPAEEALAGPHYQLTWTECVGWHDAPAMDVAVPCEETKTPSVDMLPNFLRTTPKTQPRLPLQTRRRFYPHQWRTAVEPQFQKIAEQNSLTLSWLGWDRSLPRLYLDGNILTQIVEELISYASHAFDSVSEIRIRAAWQVGLTKRLMLTIEDDATGIDTDRLRQINTSRMSRKSQSELGPESDQGLIKACRLAELLGGHLSAQVGHSGGTQYFLALPVDDVQSLVHRWLVNCNGPTVRDRADKARVTVFEVCTSHINTQVADRQLQHAASPEDFVYRLDANRWAWLSYWDSDHREARLPTIIERLVRVAKELDGNASCAASLQSTIDIGSTRVLSSLPVIVELLREQVDKLLGGRVPAVDAFPIPPILPDVPGNTIRTLIRQDEPNVDVRAPRQFATREESGAIGEVAQQWRIIQRKLQRVQALYAAN